MNLQQKKVIYLGIIGLSVVIIGYTLYYFYGIMGGFKEVTVVEMEPIKRKVAGIHYQGTVQNHDYAKIRKTCEHQIMEKKLNGYLTEITFQNDSLDSKIIDQFVGITLNTSMAEIPYEFEVREFVSPKRYVIGLGMHPMVRKPASKYEEMIRAKAREDGVTLAPMFVAIHYSTDSMAVEGWIAAEN